MKILHVLDHSLPIHSGYSFRSEEIIRAQIELGYEIVARTGPKQYSAKKNQKDESRIVYRRSSYSNKFVASIAVVRQLEVIRILRREICNIDTNDQVNLIHAHSPSLNGIAAVWAAKSMNLPVVYEMRASWEDAAVDHGTTNPSSLRYKLTRESESWVLRHADAITTICEGLKEDICARGIPDEKVSIIPNAVDSDRFKPLTQSKHQLRERFDAIGRFVVVFCGSFYSYEGLDQLIEAVADLREKIPQVLVLLAGGGEQENELRNQVRTLRLDNHVRFLGRVTQEDVVNLYNISDACVFPRRRMKLTDKVTPLKPLEAMATGAIVVASDVGGHRELISDRKTGLLFKADDPKVLSKLLCELSESSKYSSLRISAREFVTSERTWSKSVSKYDEVYQYAVSARGKR